jgi:hypothetical protein
VANATEAFAITQSVEKMLFRNYIFYLVSNAAEIFLIQFSTSLVFKRHYEK